MWQGQITKGHVYSVKYQRFILRSSGEELEDLKQEMTRSYLNFKNHSGNNQRMDQTMGR